MPNPANPNDMARHFRLKKQCKSCPWRVECDPENDIPRYEHEWHEGLLKTCIGPKASALMQCHQSTDDEPLACVGWIHNQVGPGNNFLLRRILSRLPEDLGPFEVDGEQHERFEDTLPENKR